MDIVKTFTHPSGKQVVVLRCEDDETGNPAISVMVEPDGLGICQHKSSWPSTDQGEMTRDRKFDDCTEEVALQIADQILGAVAELPDVAFDWRIIGPDGPVGDPGPVYVISEECSRLNDALNDAANTARNGYELSCTE